MYYSIAFNDRSLKYRLYRKARRVWGLLFATINEKPVFILGNQKSGTTAIALLLADAVCKSVTIDLIKEIDHPEFYYLIDQPGKLEEFIKKNRVDFSRCLIKEPNLTLFYPLLYKRFPEARSVMVIRDPRDNIRSILDRLQLRGDMQATVEDIRPTISKSWYYVLNNRWHLDCSEHYIDSLSARWNFMADVYLGSREDVCLVRYEDFRQNKQGVIHQLAKALGLAIRRDIGPLVDRQFQSRGKHKRLDIRQFFGPDNLRRIESICSKRMAAFGYQGYRP